MKHPKRGTSLLAAVILFCAVFLAGGAAAAQVSVTLENGRYVLENEQVRLAVNPAQGGLTLAILAMVVRVRSVRP